jgi:hypothetical protein
MTILEYLAPNRYRSFPRHHRIKRRRMTPAMDSRPVPTSSSDCGSGTSTDEEQCAEKTHPSALCWSRVQLPGCGATALSTAMSCGARVAECTALTLTACLELRMPSPPRLAIGVACNTPADIARSKPICPQNATDCLRVPAPNPTDTCLRPTIVSSPVLGRILRGPVLVKLSAGEGRSGLLRCYCQSR